MGRRTLRGSSSEDRGIKVESITDTVPRLSDVELDCLMAIMCRGRDSTASVGHARVAEYFNDHLIALDDERRRRRAVLQSIARQMGEHPGIESATAVWLDEPHPA